MEEQTKEFQDYLAAIKKRKTGILVIIVTVLAISAAVAFLLPPKYQSKATILIEQQEIPKELVMSTVTSYAAERIQVIQARVMSRANLLKIVDKYNLYADERKYKTTQSIIGRMQNDVGLDIISADVIDPRTGRAASATIAFNLSFSAESPSVAQKVTNELTTLYLNENLKNRTQKAEDTSVFFGQEAKRLGAKIADLEKKLATFKQVNAELLPGVQQLNMQMLQRKESEVIAFDVKLNALDDKKFYMTNQLAQMDPVDPSVPGVKTRLKLLEANYISMKSKYSEDHPDLLKLKREIESLKEEADSSSNTDAIAREITMLRAQLVEVKKKYTPEHPDVIRLQSKIDSLGVELASAQTNIEDEYYKDKPDNPAYLSMQAQLAGIDSEIKSILLQKKNITEEITALEKKMLLAPEVERELLLLTRDYDNAVSEYRQTKAKLSRADIAKQLESEKKGERFTLIDPPALPEEPISPNRPAIMFLGFVMALGSGIGFAFIADAISGSVRGAMNIQSMLGVAPLAVIPYQRNMADLQRRKKIQKRTILTGIMILVAMILLIHFLISPLDVLWFRVLRKIDILIA